MKAGYTIEHYGTFNPTAIVVMNWEPLNLVSMVRFGNIENAYMPEKHTVAIFKLKPKA